jgi:hypothetical protein
MMITWEYEWVLLGIQEARMEWWFLFIRLVTIHEWPNFLNGIESNFLSYSALKSIFPKNHFFFLTLKKTNKKTWILWDWTIVGGWGGCTTLWAPPLGVVGYPNRTTSHLTTPCCSIRVGWLAAHGGWVFILLYFWVSRKINNNDFFGKCYSYWGNSYSLPFWEEWK